MAEAVAFRRICSDDIDGLAALVADAFAGYRAFAPGDWQPPAASEQVAVLRRWIGDPDFWGEVARREGALVGHVTFIPAGRHSFRATADPAVAHLGHLFVEQQYWGTGVAAQLLEHAMSAAATRRFRAMRLFVPAGQARARRFYAREGFAAVGEPFDLGLGLPVLEYRRALDS
jgi:GNAT superfamily N-acetyltransferase